MPIEVGDSYTAAGWEHQLMTFADYVDHHIEETDDDSDAGAGRSSVAYLAQHPLFEQVPALREDIRTPKYCSYSALPAAGKGHQQEPPQDDGVRQEALSPAVNGWFGPRDTVTPLHHDPKHNLLCQAVGKKYLRLYAADTRAYVNLLLRWAHQKKLRLSQSTTTAVWSSGA